MRDDYRSWLEEKRYAEGTRNTQLNRVRRVEEAYGDLEEHLAGGTFGAVVESLNYSTADERTGRPNPSKMRFDGNIRNNLQSYKNAANLYGSFLLAATIGSGPRPTETEEELVAAADESVRQRLSLERDMQSALRRNIAALDPSLRIVDDGIERKVESGFIDITCEDAANQLVVVELKAGKADSGAIGQILGYMGDLALEESREVRGILVAHEFDKRTRAAERVVPTLILMRYHIEFQFEKEG